MERKGKEDGGRKGQVYGHRYWSSVGIGLSVLWYRVIVQRRNIEWLFKTATLKVLDPDEAWSNSPRSIQIILASPKMNSCHLPQG